MVEDKVVLYSSLFSSMLGIHRCWVCQGTETILGRFQRRRRGFLLSCSLFHDDRNHKVRWMCRSTPIGPPRNERTTGSGDSSFGIYTVRHLVLDAFSGCPPCRQIRPPVVSSLATLDIYASAKRGKITLEGFRPEATRLRQVVSCRG